jgi:hypothetical protein
VTGAAGRGNFFGLFCDDRLNSKFSLVDMAAEVVAIAESLDCRLTEGDLVTISGGAEAIGEASCCFFRSSATCCSLVSIGSAGPSLLDCPSKSNIGDNNSATE